MGNETVPTKVLSSSQSIERGIHILKRLNAPKSKIVRETRLGITERHCFENKQLTED